MRTLLCRRLGRKAAARLDADEDVARVKVGVDEVVPDEHLEVRLRAAPGRPLPYSGVLIPALASSPAGRGTHCRT